MVRDFHAHVFLIGISQPSPLVASLLFFLGPISTKVFDADFLTHLAILPRDTSRLARKMRKHVTVIVWKILSARGINQLLTI